MVRNNAARASASAIRCAIYTRKSSDEGLEQEFNSLDAQREACEAYTLSQRHAGWLGLPDMYDDGGLSGGTMERPALKRLLDDVRAGKIQIIVVYKVDRLTRSLADFAKIVDILDAHRASFVSVTQQFNTTTSMGRLTLNMLLSFAQFEREIAGERIRDKIAASKRKGMWMGGNVPLGYDVKDRKLIINEVEAATVGGIFKRYAELGSVAPLKAELDKAGIVSKRREGPMGQLSGGKSFSRGALYLMLQNRIYRGEIKHKGEIYPGQHDAIIDPDLWTLVQERLTNNRHERSVGATAEDPSLLTGLIFDSVSGERLTPSHAKKETRRYRYYVSTIPASVGNHSKGPARIRIPAGDIEGLVLDKLRCFFADNHQISNAIALLNLDAHAFEGILQSASDISARWSSIPRNELVSLIQQIIHQVRIDNNKIEISLKHSAIAATLGATHINTEPDLAPIIIPIEASLKRSGKGKRLIIENGVASDINVGIIELFQEAFHIRNMLTLVSSDDSIEAMSQRLGINKHRLTSLIRLSYVSPEIIRALIEGRHPIELTPTRLLKMSKDLPHDWREQRQFLGFEA